MTRVLGRRVDETGATGRLGRYRARDGSDGAPVDLDLSRPHAGLVVGKRGYGKSYTLGVLAEELAAAPGVVPVVVDPMGAFDTLAAAPVDATVVESPAVPAASLPPRAWCDLVGLDPASAPGTLLWAAVAEADALAGMREHVLDAEASHADRRAAANHLDLAASWGVFDPAGLDAAALVGEDAVVLDCSRLDRAPMNAVVRAVASALYRHCVRGEPAALPWLLLDEAHACFDGVAAPALRTVLTRGRAPGVSLVAATQRPSALPDVAVSQADLLVSHRLTSRTDLEALAAARPIYLDGPLEARLPEERGVAAVVDDATERVHAVRIRERRTPHGGDSARASTGPEDSTNRTNDAPEGDPHLNS